MREDSVGLLFDYAVSKPEGFTYEDVEQDLGWPRERFFSVTRRFRRMFAEDQINLVCEPQEQREPWLYKLVGKYDDARLWATNRVEDLVSRTHTIHSVSRTLTNATDGRSTEGRKARLIERKMRQLIEELGDL
jgi:hypothetical protein